MASKGDWAVVQAVLGGGGGGGGVRRRSTGDDRAQVEGGTRHGGNRPTWSACLPVRHLVSDTPSMSDPSLSPSLSSSPPIYYFPASVPSSHALPFCMNDIPIPGQFDALPSPPHSLFLSLQKQRYSFGSGRWRGAIVQPRGS